MDGLILSDFVAGGLRTLSLAAFSWSCGLPIGLALGFMAGLRGPQRHIVRGFAVFLSVVPFLAILFWAHYPLQVILDVVWSPFYTTTVLLSLFVAFSVAQALAESVKRLRHEFADAAKVLGISQRLFLYRIVLPSALELSLPRFLSIAIISIHMTMFASLIGVEELFRVAQRVNARILRPVEIYSAMALAYAAICLPLFVIERMLRSRLENV